MANEFKQCPNGHYYLGATCPYCKSGNGNSNQVNTSGPTEIINGGGTNEPTETISQETIGNSGGTKTQIYDGGFSEEPTMMPTQGAANGNSGTSSNASTMSSRTVFGDENETETVITPTGQKVVKQGYRSTRKLVGWLVSYTLDNMGVDFKLYEGRNIIGRDMECNITVNDNMVSAKHAVILFRAGKYSITDQQSTHGTFVNNADIDLEPCYLSDGDTIRIGQTIFKFRTSF